jgi:hypothetical protein
MLIFYVNELRKFPPPPPYLPTIPIYLYIAIAMMENLIIDVIKAQTLMLIMAINSSNVNVIKVNDGINANNVINVNPFLIEGSKDRSACRGITMNPATIIQ